MKRIKICWNCIRSSLRQIPLVDKCLLVFFTVLLLQSAHSLFSIHGMDTDAEHIDVVVRTSLASIFGYVLSANFIQGSDGQRKRTTGNKNQTVIQTSDVYSQSIVPDRQTDPSSSDLEISRERDTAEHTAQDDSIVTRRLQIIVATMIGLFCLTILILLRHANIWNTGLPESSPATATIAQFRDFVSGCVGFLIGSPSSKTNQ